MIPAPALYAAATVGYGLCALLYFHGHFRSAGVVGGVFAVLMAWLVPLVMGPIAATLVLVFLLGIPAAVLLAHVYDAGRGIFLLPTIYSIPLAFLAGALLWIVTGLVLLF
jgi:hypothetical protein